MSARIALQAMALALALALPGAGVAADREHPIDISARESQYDVGTGVWNFSGEVRIVYGNVEAHGDAGIVQQQDEEITGIELLGSPATWREILDDGHEIAGQARAIRFDPVSELLVMTGDTRVRHPRGVFSGDRLVYDLVSRTLSGASEAGGRVRMTIEPPDPAPE